MPDAFQPEFTGERVIPGLVEANLFNEHVARYRFAARLSEQLNLAGTFLDAGCGTGYGSAELAKSGRPVLAVDVSPDALAHAKAHYSAAGIRFEQASCTAIPSADSAFHLIAAFEVIEHLLDWRGFLGEMSRVLHPAGVFVVSTPNRFYYAESRRNAGANPFHQHEFDYAEFRSELEAIFPHVRLLFQNHVEGIAFTASDAGNAAVEISGSGIDPAAAHFFLAVCGKHPLPEIPDFVFIPDSGNVLQTRERHIALLDAEIIQKNLWIEREQAERDRLLEKVRDLEVELEEHNRWARVANEEADRRAELVVQLQEELLRSNEWAKACDRETEQAREKLELSNQLRDAEAKAAGARIVELQNELQEEQRKALEAVTRLEVEKAESSAGYEAAIEQWRLDKAAADRWALDTQQRLDEARQQIDTLNARLALVAQSRWIRLGRALRLGPVID